MNSEDYTIVLTSCNRFDLLKQTLQSLFQYIDYPPKDFILIEDSGNVQIYDLVAHFNFPIKVILNTKKLGQIRSIDLAYSQVTTPYIFHCEDDWKFLRTGFIQESIILLKNIYHASVVQLRGRNEHPKLKFLPKQNLKNIPYFLATKKSDRRYFGYSFNPSMRRLSDYQKVAPFERIGNERQIYWVFKLLGYVTVHLEKAAVTHLGDYNHTVSPCKPEQGGNRKKQLLTNAYKRFKWQLFGFPTHNKPHLNQNLNPIFLNKVALNQSPLMLLVYFLKSEKVSDKLCHCNCVEL